MFRRTLTGMEILVDACWSVFVVVWLVTALVDRRSAPPVERRTPWWSIWLAAAAAYALVAWLVPGPVWAPVTVHSTWLAVVGAVVLVASLAFALWARLRLGTMWNSAPTIKAGHELRTDGPYALTRHPIYTGLLGMLAGTVLVGGLGSGLVIVVLVAVPLALKIRTEERMLTAQFPEAYPAYRAAVPALVPGLRRLLT